MRVRRGRRVHRLAAGLMGWVALSLALAATVSAAGAPEYLRSFGPDGSSSTEFEVEASSIAVDQQSGAVYVLARSEAYVGEGCPFSCFEGTLYKFDSDGNPVSFTGLAPYISGSAITGLPITPEGVQVAVDPTSHDIYVTSANAVQAFQANGEEAEFTAGPGSGTNEIGGFSELRGLAVDANGAIYAADRSTGEVRIYAHSGEAITQFSAPEAENLAVDAHGAAYVDSFNGLYKYTPSIFPVNPATTYSAAAEPFDPHRSNSVAVDPESNDVYVAEVDSLSGPAGIARYDEAGNLLTTFAGPEEEGEVSNPRGISVLGSNTRLFVSDFAFNRPSQVEIFGYVPGAPKVVRTSATDVTADSATLRADINPDSFDTHYRFEYGLEDCAVSACTSVPLGGADLGAGTESVAVSQNIAGLEPGTTYHFRVVAENSAETTSGPDRIFATQLRGFGFTLADDRAWEMVSPPDKHGALLPSNANGLVQAAANGEGLTFPSIGSIEPDPDGNRSLTSDAASVLAWRTVQGWGSKDITPRSDVVAGATIGSHGQYKVFSRDLTQAALEPQSPTPLSPGGASVAPYLRSAEPFFFTSLVDRANLPSGTELDEVSGKVKIAAVAPDLSHIGLKSKGVPLIEGAPSSGTTLYVWAAGQLQPVSKLPVGEGGEWVTDGSFGSMGFGQKSIRHAISDDGSRAFWELGKGFETHLYMRNLEAEATVRLDVPQPGALETGAVKPVFQGANAQGTVVFFTDTQQLTPGASPEGADLYRCEIPAGPLSTGCATLTDVSAPLEGSGESAEVRGLITGMSDDGSTVYFVANGVLDDEANGFGDSAIQGKPNLYAWRQGEGARFVAALSQKDENDWGAAEGKEVNLSANASPSGRYLVFASRRGLTGSDNLDKMSGKPVEEVFRYDATGEQLDCLSCNPTGGAPIGAEPKEFGLVNSGRQWNGVMIAAAITGPPINEELETIVLYTPRSVLDNGRVFFNSIDPLVAADSNGQWDVYQYEPTGVGDCSGSSGGPSIIRSAGGCVSLISSGTGEEEAGFLDASASGDDAFFLTPAQLNEPDQDHEYDIYDARVHGVLATLPTRAECLGEACQPLPAGPNDPTPASATFAGPGNRKQHHKHCRKAKRRVRRHGRVVCLRVHHRRSHKRGSNNGGGRR